MKRFVLLILTLSLLTLSFVSCGPKPAPTPDVYERLNGLFATPPDNLTLETAVTVGEQTLRGTYRATKTGEDAYLVTYSYETFALFDTEGDTLTAPDTEIRKITGSATVTSSAITSEGESVEGATLPTDLCGLRFKKSDFTDVTDAGGVFSATVVDPSDFYGTTVAVNHMKIEVGYGFYAVEYFTVTYEKSGAAVTLTYRFS